MTRIVCLVLALLSATAAVAQHNHAQHHAYYQHWQNQNGANCCNDQDCGELAEGSERSVNGRIEVRVGDEWCPVMPFHYLSKGNAPNWSVSHACILKYPAQSNKACDRLLCYQPKPGI